MDPFDTARTRVIWARVLGTDRTTAATIPETHRAASAPGCPNADSSGCDFRAAADAAASLLRALALRYSGGRRQRLQRYSRTIQMQKRYLDALCYLKEGQYPAGQKNGDAAAAVRPRTRAELLRRTHAALDAYAAHAAALANAIPGAEEMLRRFARQAQTQAAELVWLLTQEQKGRCPGRDEK